MCCVRIPVCATCGQSTCAHADVTLRDIQGGLLYFTPSNQLSCGFGAGRRVRRQRCGHGLQGCASPARSGSVVLLGLDCTPCLSLFHFSPAFALSVSQWASVGVDAALGMGRNGGHGVQPAWMQLTGLCIERSGAGYCDSPPDLDILAGSSSSIAGSWWLIWHCCSSQLLEPASRCLLHLFSSFSV